MFIDSLKQFLALALDTAMMKERLRPLKSHGLELREVSRRNTTARRKDKSNVARIVMTHVPKGKVWSGPGITGSVRRAMQRSA